MQFLPTDAGSRFHLCFGVMILRKTMPPRRLQHTGCLLGKPHFRNYKPRFRFLAKPCNLSQVRRLADNDGEPSGLPATLVGPAMRVGLRSLLFTFFIPGSITVWIPWLMLAHRLPTELAVPLYLRLPGGLLVAAGTALYLSCLWDFTFTGRGTPAVWDPPVVFVSKGVYRFVRNPMYLAIVSILLGEALFFQWVLLGWMATGVAVGFHLFVVYYEERALRRRFGASYERYCSEVFRWVPRWPRR